VHETVSACHESVCKSLRENLHSVMIMFVFIFVCVCVCVRAYIFRVDVRVPTCLYLSVSFFVCVRISSFCACAGVRSFYLLLVFWMCVLCTCKYVRGLARASGSRWLSSVHQHGFSITGHETKIAKD